MPSKGHKKMQPPRDSYAATANGVQVGVILKRGFGHDFVSCDVRYAALSVEAHASRRAGCGRRRCL